MSEIIYLDIKNIPRKLILSFFSQKLHLGYQKPPKMKATKYFVQ